MFLPSDWLRRPGVNTSAGNGW